MARRGNRHGQRAAGENGSQSPNESMLEGADQTSAIFVRGMLAFQQETFEFVNRRLEHDADLLRQYRECRTMMDMLAAQQRWLVHMSQDYYLESIRLAKAVGGLVSNETEEFARTIEETEQRAAA